MLAKLFAHALAPRASTIRVADFLLGHSQRRGAPGRAIVDWKDPNSGTTALMLNFAGDWNETIIGGNVTEVRTLRITGGADLAEPFAMPATIEKGSVVVIDEDNPGRLNWTGTITKRKLDRSTLRIETLFDTRSL